MSANPGAGGASSVASRKVLLGVAAALAVVVVVVVVWTLRCPCDATPGFVLLGDSHEQPVADWSFANEVSLCQIQIGIALRPHSVNVNCMATPEGELFISCSVGDQKYWCPRVQQDHAGRLRLDGVVYPVFLNREMDPATLDRVWASRIRKLQKPHVHARQPGSGDPPPLDTPRPDSWWTFRVESRT